MTYPTYLRYEVLRNFRNWRFLILTLAFPLVLYVLVGSVNRHVTFEHIAFPVYFMTAMATLGTMAAVLAGSAVIAAERATGWTRQMRITPLPARVYFRAKLVVGYLRALLTLVLLALAGTALGGHDWPLEGWIVVAAWTVVLVPLAVRVYRRDTGRV